jgi:selenide,water dikinase
MRCGGCGAKVGSDILARALARVRTRRRDDILIGLDAPDDAAVVEVPSCKVLVQSVDFFRAMIDDPYVFGQIAANHALGDLYAMGADPHSALAVVGIPYGPEEKVEEVLTDLLAGAVEVLHAAGADLVGGHTSEAAELGLGFTVNGIVDRSKLLRRGGLRDGDRVVLTKPIGTGTLFAADMRYEARGRWIASAVRSMTQSSRAAAECLIRHGATACTDVTGFGLLGHLHEMAAASAVGVSLDLASVPLLDGAEQTAKAGLLSTLYPQNLRLGRVIKDVGNMPAIPRFALLFDPQTAGGLLAGVPAGRVDTCLADLRAAGYSHSAVVGTVVPRGSGSEIIAVNP